MNAPKRSEHTHWLWDCGISYILVLNNGYSGFNRDSIAVVVSLDGKFDAEVEGQLHKGINGQILNRKTNCVYRGEGSRLLITVVEPRSIPGKILMAMLGEKNVLEVDLPANLFSKTENPVPVQTFIPERKTLILQTERLFDFLIGPKPNDKVVDKRIRLVLEYIEKNLGESMDLAAIADLSHLSIERVRHLFTEQVGMPFTKYILWRRLRGVIYAVSAGRMRLNQAIGQFGFTDQAHFNHTFKNIFGVSPKGLFQVALVVV